MNKNSNTYTFVFASAMVIIVAVLLALAALGLKSYQDKNERAEKMQNILYSIGVTTSRDKAENLFNKYLKEKIVLTAKGQIDQGEIDPFDIDLKKELDKQKTGDEDKQLFPLFVFQKDGKSFYVIPVRGKGLCHGYRSGNGCADKHRKIYLRIFNWNFCHTYPGNKSRLS